MTKVLFDRLSFLVVDDNTYARRLIRTILFSFGSRQVHEAEDGASALELIELHQPDIVVTDLIMPVFDGFDLVRTIRHSKSDYAAMPIILVTAHAEKKHVLEARKLGVSEFLRKPFSANAFYERVQSIMTKADPVAVKVAAQMDSIDIAASQSLEAASDEQPEQDSTWQI